MHISTILSRYVRAKAKTLSLDELREEMNLSKKNGNQMDGHTEWDTAIK
jgi:hypothetical protein